MSNILNRLPEHLLRIARPYQKIGVRLIDRYDGRCLLADDMGLGKTLQAIMHLLIRPDLRPALVVMPATAKLKWAKEFQKWAPYEKVQIVSGKKDFEIEGDVVLINWDIIHYSKIIPNRRYNPALEGSKKTVKKFFLRDELRETRFKIVIGDEIQKISNFKAGRSIAFKEVCKGVEKVIGMSGEPMENRPIDFYAILSILKPFEFGNYVRYVQRYCGGKSDYWSACGFETKGASNLDELHDRVSAFMIRRKKREVLKELPELNRIIIPLKIDNRRHYNHAENNYFGYLRAMGKSTTKAIKAVDFTHTNVLETLAVQGILKQVLAWVGDYIETGNKLVVGCIRRDINTVIYKKFKKQAVQIWGGMSSTQKQRSIDSFQEDPNVKLAVCNLRSAGEAIDLYAANATATIEFMWNPAIHKQFEARIDRIGQTASEIFAYYLVGSNTIYERKAEFLDGKRSISSVVTDGKELKNEEKFINLLREAEENELQKV